jgi:2-keto-4-pentenoate hydratase
VCADTKTGEKMTGAEIAALAGQLVEARHTRVPIRRVAGLSAHDAALVKAEVGRLLGAQERGAVAAYKVSMPMTAGFLFEMDVLPAPAQIARSSLILPLVEAEAIFYLEDEILPGMSATEVMERCRIGVGFEICDGRWDSWRPDAPELLRQMTGPDMDADNGFAALLVTGDGTVSGASLPDLAECRMHVYRDGAPCASGLLSRVMGHPARAVSWLAGKLGERGETLRPGQMVASGNPSATLLTLGFNETACFEANLDGVGGAAVEFI